MDAQQRLERRAGQLMAEWRTMYLRQVFLFGEMANARAREDYARLAELAEQLKLTRIDTNRLQRGLFSLRSQLIQLRMARAGFTANNFGPVPDHMPEGDL